MIWLAKRLAGIAGLIGLLVLYTSAWEGRGGPASHGDELHEAINTIAAVLGATLVGIDQYDLALRCADGLNQTVDKRRRHHDRHNT
ncbi:MAG: hypothetical protein ABSF26_10225 [Thermoguttaceae bacterium]|jgi:hypothetical protein